jgi:hypothetical protein
MLKKNKKIRKKCIKSENKSGLCYSTRFYKSFSGDNFDNFLNLKFCKFLNFYKKSQPLFKVTTLFSGKLVK